MADCDLSSGRCPLCGFSSNRPIFRNCPAVPQNKPEPSPAGLGDRVASFLDAVGITKARVQAAASSVGVADCGCSSRQAALNAAGAKYLGLSPGSTAPPPVDSGT